NISFSIRNFLLDSEAGSNKEKFFFTDDIDLEMRNQRIFLKDSVHTLYFKKLLLSTTQSEIIVDSLVVSENKAHQLRRDHQDLYKIYVPAFSIKNIDFKSAYNEEILNIGRLNIFLPPTNISDFPQASDNYDSTGNSLASLVLG